MALNIPSLASLALNQAALAPYLNSNFSVSLSDKGFINVSLKKNSDSQKSYCIHNVTRPATTQCSSSSDNATLTRRSQGFSDKETPIDIRLRRRRRQWVEEILRWGDKHDQILLIAHDLNFDVSVKDLVVCRHQFGISDEETAYNFVFKATSRGLLPPEELRFCMAALYCIDAYFTIGKRKPAKLTKIFSGSGSRISQYTATLSHLWQGGALAANRKHFFRKFCHKGFSQLACHILASKGSTFGSPPPYETELHPERNELILLYLHALSSSHAAALRTVEAFDPPNYCPKEIAKVLLGILPRLSNRPRLFEAALKFVQVYISNREITSCLKSLLKAEDLLRACTCYNVTFVKCIYDYCGYLQLEECFPEIVEMCKKSNSKSLGAVYDTISSAVPDCWQRILGKDNFQLYREAFHSGCASSVDILFEGCKPDFKKPMILSAYTRRNLCCHFVKCCENNQVELLRVMQKYFPDDLWDEIVRDRQYNGAMIAAKQGSIQILEMIRERYGSVDDRWSDLLNSLRGPSDVIFEAAAMHYLYLETELRPMLEEEYDKFRMQQRAVCLG